MNIYKEPKTQSDRLKGFQAGPPASIDRVKQKSAASSDYHESKKKGGLIREISRYVGVFLAFYGVKAFFLISLLLSPYDALMAFIWIFLFGGLYLLLPIQLIHFGIGHFKNKKDWQALFSIPLSSFILLSILISIRNDFPLIFIEAFNFAIFPAVLLLFLWIRRDQDNSPPLKLDLP